MDHETMNLWDDPAVVKAYADAAIECFGNTRLGGIFARIKRRVLGEVKSRSEEVKSGREVTSEREEARETSVEDASAHPNSERSAK